MDENYKQAEKAFRDNLKRCDINRDPVSYDLYAGPVNLTLALQCDLGRMERLLEQLVKETRSRG